MRGGRFGGDKPRDSNWILSIVDHSKAKVFIFNFYSFLLIASVVLVAICKPSSISVVIDGPRQREEDRCEPSSL